MPNGLKNWTYNDVVDLLKTHHFTLNHTRGSHHYFIGLMGGRFRQVCVPYHGSLAVKPRTMRGIILQSGVPKEVWLKR